MEGTGRRLGQLRDCTPMILRGQCVFPDRQAADHIQVISFLTAHDTWLLVELENGERPCSRDRLFPSRRLAVALLGLRDAPRRPVVRTVRNQALERSERPCQGYQRTL